MNNHLKSMHRRLAELTAVLHALADRTQEGGNAYRRAHTLAREGIARAARGDTMTQRMRKRSRYAGLAFDVARHFLTIGGGAKALETILYSDREQLATDKKQRGHSADEHKGAETAPEAETRERSRDVPPRPPVSQEQAHGKVGHIARYGQYTIRVEGDDDGPRHLALCDGNTVAERRSISEVPSDKSPPWLWRYWGEIYLLDYLRTAPQASLQKPECYQRLLEAMTGVEGDEPEACPEDAHPKIKEFWAQCARGIRDWLETGTILSTPGARRAGALYAKDNNLGRDIKWNEEAQKFDWTPEFRQSVAEDDESLPMLGNPKAEA